MRSGSSWGFSLCLSDIEPVEFEERCAEDGEQNRPERPAADAPVDRSQEEEEERREGEALDERGEQEPFDERDREGDRPGVLVGAERVHEEVPREEPSRVEAEGFMEREVRLIANGFLPCPPKPWRRGIPASRKDIRRR